MLFFQLINIHFYKPKKSKASLLFEVKMIMIAALWIEAAAAIRALVITTLVFVDRHFMFTYAAENGFRIKFIFAPYFSLMSCCFVMAKKARVISITTFEFDRNYIKRRMIMYAACLIVNKFAFYFNHDASFNLSLIAPTVFQQFFQHHYKCRDAQPMFVQQYCVLL
jgi:hypothetical protein